MQRPLAKRYTPPPCAVKANLGQNVSQRCAKQVKAKRNVNSASRAHAAHRSVRRVRLRRSALMGFLIIASECQEGFLIPASACHQAGFLISASACQHASRGP